MKNWFRKFATLVACSLLLTSAAHAMLITVSFTASGFVPNTGSSPGPFDPINSTIAWEAESATSRITSLSSISLVIGGHTYNLGDLGFENFTNDLFVGGLLNGIRSLD